MTLYLFYTRKKPLDVVLGTETKHTGRTRGKKNISVELY